MNWQDVLRERIGNLTGRRQSLLAGTSVIALAAAFGGLSLQFAFLGTAGLWLWGLVWPASTSNGAIEMWEARRKTELASDAARAWKSIVENFPDPALVLNQQGRVLAINALASELFAGAGPGPHISSITRAPDLLTTIDGVSNGGNAQSCRLDFKVPVERSLVASVAPLNIEIGDDEIPQTLIVLRDLTEQDRLVRMRADFVANASHELRTPLASLKGFVETLQGAAKDDPLARAKFLKIMQMQADRMARLIEDLLSLSRIEMQAHVLPRDKVELAGVIAHVAQTLVPIAAEKDITLDIGAVPSAVVQGDRDELIQVFQNLIENAIKYGRTGGRVVVKSDIHRTPPRAGTIAVSIVDDGPGIAPEHLPRLTERFYRVNAAHSRTTGGTGLGLAIVKHVLNRHQGDLAIESATGKGSTFRVTLPIIEK